MDRGGRVDTKGAPAGALGASSLSFEQYALLNSARPRASGDPYVDGPRLARWLQRVNRSDCDHMSGLLTRPHMTAAKMGSATRVPNSAAALNRPLGPSECLASGIDRSHHLSLSSKLRPTARGEVRRHAEEL